MKKLIIFAGAMLLLAAGTAAFFASRPMSAQGALILKNVEAIARGEGDKDGAERRYTRTYIGDVYKNDANYIYLCKAEITETIGCYGQGELSCTLGQKTITGTPYNCEVIGFADDPNDPGTGLAK